MIWFTRLCAAVERWLGFGPKPPYKLNYWIDPNGDYHYESYPPKRTLDADYEQSIKDRVEDERNWNIDPSGKLQWGWIDVSDAEQKQLEALGGPDVFFGRLPPPKRSRKPSKAKAPKKATPVAKKATKATKARTKRSRTIP